MTGAAAAVPERGSRPSYGAAALAAVAVLGLYGLTLAPTAALWDASEYIAAAYTVGLPHPPGNPLFVLIGRVFAMLPIAPTVAMRLNLLAALASAASAGVWFLVTEHVLARWLPHRWQRLAGATCAALLGATAFTVWHQSVVSEKVYPLALLGIALVTWLAVRWCEEPDGPAADRRLVLIAFLLGLGCTNHMAGLLPGPAVALAVLAIRPRTFTRWRLLLACAGTLLLGLTPFATQPIRAAHFPAINQGEPTGCTDGIGVACTLSRTTWERFAFNLSRGQYGKPALTERQAPATAQLGMLWLYFTWQWWRDAYGERPGLQNALATLVFVMGLLGGWVHWQRDRRSWWVVAPLLLTLTLGLVSYLNFKLGHSQALELGDTVRREARDRDYFFLWAFSAWSVWAALGLVYLWESVAGVLGWGDATEAADAGAIPSARRFALAAPVLLVAALPLIGNWAQASRAGHTDAVDFAHDLLQSVEPYGILVTIGDNDTFPLWYAQEVERVRRDVLVVNLGLLGTDWYTRQVIRRPVEPYDAARGPAVYRDRVWPAPSSPALRLSIAEADAIPEVVDLGEDRAVATGGLGFVPPRRQVSRAEFLLFALIRDAWPERPLHFSRTLGGLPASLGVGPQLLTQGLARKLMARPVAPSGDTVFVRGEGAMDVTRSARLWREVFAAPRSLAARDGWVDDASVGIPDLYVLSGLGLAEGLALTGRASDADAIFRATRAIARAMRRLDVFGLDTRERVLPSEDAAAPSPPTPR